MTEQLRLELQRMGNDAPAIRPDPDIWRRGRAARRRQRLGSLAAVALCIASLGAAAWIGPLQDRSPEILDGGSRDAGVPAQIWAVPERLTLENGAGEWAGPVESNLAIGVASAAFVTNTGLPVVITAGDGDYHLLDLPGVHSLFGRSHAKWGEGTWLALSPDGRQIAFAYAVGNKTSAIKVLKLETGAIRTTTMSNPNTDVRGLGWSPNSQWIAWHGLLWQPQTNSWRTPVAGVVGPESSQSQVEPIRDRSLTVTDNGQLIEVGRHRVGPIDGSGVKLDSTVEAAAGKAAALAPNGVALAIAGPAAEGVRFLGMGDGSVSTTHLPGHNASLLGSIVRPLGWIDNEHLVVVAHRPAEGELSEEKVIGIVEHPARGSSYDVVGVVEREYPETLTIAVDLMTLEQPTVQMPEPRWPWSTERKILVAMLFLTGLACAAYALVGLRRRRLQ